MAVSATDQFWITGLPRSRTAWFSVAMRGPHSVCHHELTARALSYADLKRLWAPVDGFNVGNADSACGLHAARILADIAPRTLIVDRPLGEVLESCQRLYRHPLPGLGVRLEQLQDALTLSHPLIKRVRFADLDDRDALIEAADWLVPGQGERASELMRMNIAVTATWARGLLTLPHTLWHMKEAA